MPHKSGVIVQETTANGFGNWFQKQYYKYVAGEGRYNGFFYPWNIHEDYNSQSPLRAKSEDESLLAATYSLSDSQLQWRREKIDELEGDEDLFHQEYPLSYQEAFRSTGGSLFTTVEVSPSKDWVAEDRNTWVLKGHPKEGLHYVLGADSAGGTGHDFSAIFGMCVETREQVLSYRDRKINPPAFGKVLRSFGKRFNTAYLVPESNSHGLSVLAVIKEDYPLLNIYRTLISKNLPSQTIQVPSYGYGWKTTSITKPYMVGIAQRFIDEGVKIYDPITVDELLSFTETEEGKLEGSGDNDDSAISFMLACMGYVKAVKFLARAEGKNVIFFEQEKEARRIQRLDPMKKYRDAEGRYLIPFEEIVKEKKRRLVG